MPAGVRNKSVLARGEILERKIISPVLTATTASSKRASRLSTSSTTHQRFRPTTNSEAATSAGEVFASFVLRDTAEERQASARGKYGGCRACVVSGMSMDDR